MSRGGWAVDSEIEMTKKYKITKTERREKVVTAESEADALFEAAHGWDDANDAQGWDFEGTFTTTIETLKINLE